MVKLESFEVLDKWLSENAYFEDGHVLSINDSPLEIVIGYNILGNYKANTERHIRNFKLRPDRIIEWTYDRNLVEVSEDNYVEYIEATKSENGICLQFGLPAIFLLTTNSLNIEEQEVIITTFKPWVSDKELNMSANLDEIPRPEFWSNKLRELNHNVMFRYFAGDQRLPEEVPYPDYQGYYIQLVDRINFTQTGIFLKFIRIENGALALNFENQDQEIKHVWDDLTRILADLPGAKISSGNCEFSGEEWKEYLNVCKTILN